MNSDSGFRDAGTPEQARGTHGFRIVRSVAGLIFLLIAVGLTAAHRMRPEADTSVVNAPRPQHAASEPDAPSRGMLSRQSNQATAIQSQAGAY